jgi:hypothetical protein
MNFLLDENISPKTALKNLLEEVTPEDIYGNLTILEENRYRLRKKA